MDVTCLVQGTGLLLDFGGWDPGQRLGVVPIRRRMPPKVILDSANDEAEHSLYRTGPTGRNDTGDTEALRCHSHTAQSAAQTRAGLF